MNRDAHTGREAAVLVGIAIHSEVQEIGAYTAIIQQRVALARRAVTADALALVFGLDQPIWSVP